MEEDDNTEPEVNRGLKFLPVGPDYDVQKSMMNFLKERLTYGHAGWMRGLHNETDGDGLTDDDMPPLERADVCHVDKTQSERASTLTCFNDAGEFLCHEYIVEADCNAQWQLIRKEIDANIGRLTASFMVRTSFPYPVNMERLTRANFVAERFTESAFWLILIPANATAAAAATEDCDGC